MKKMEIDKTKIEADDGNLGGGQLNG